MQFKSARQKVSLNIDVNPTVLNVILNQGDEINVELSKPASTNIYAYLEARPNGLEIITHGIIFLITPDGVVLTSEN